MLFGAPIALALYLLPSIGATLLQNPDALSLVRIASLYILLMLPTYCLDSILIINNKHWLLLQITVVWGALFFLANVYFGLAKNLEMIFVAVACLAALKMLLTLAITWRDYGGIPGFFEPKLFREVLAYSIVLGAVGFVDVLSVQIDKFLVTILTRSEEAFAIYAVAAYEIPLIALLIGSATAVAMPEFSRQLHSQDQPALWRLLHSMIRKLAIVIFPLFAYLLATSHAIVPLIFSEKFTASVPIFYIYLLLLPVRATNNYPLLIAAGLQRSLLLGRILDVLITIGLGVALLQWVGLAGPAIAVVTATYAEKTYQSIVLIRRFNVSLGNLYPWKFMGKWLLRVAVCALPPLILFTLAPRHIALVIGTVLFVFLYLAFIQKFYSKDMQQG
jgi:O-antigen/teichoic acid export membrane protein